MLRGGKKDHSEEGFSGMRSRGSSNFPSSVLHLHVVAILKLRNASTFG
jgi:hypothetical protein